MREIELKRRHGDVALAERGHAGHERDYGHQGPLTIPHLAMEEFLQVAGIAITDIPFRGEPLVVTDLSSSGM